MKLSRLALTIVLALFCGAPTLHAGDLSFVFPKRNVAETQAEDEPSASGGAPAPLELGKQGETPEPATDEAAPRPEDLQQLIEPEPVEASAGQPSESGVPPVIPPGSGLPASPYKAGLPYMMTPQPFRVPFFPRLYPPGPHYVQRCPYYPGGVYPGGRWFSLIGWQYRFNPYRADQIAAAHGTRRRAPLPTLTPRPGSPPPVNMYNIQRRENPTGAAVAKAGTRQGEKNAESLAESRDSARRVANDSPRDNLMRLPPSTQQASQRKSVVRRSE